MSEALFEKRMREALERNGIRADELVEAIVSVGGSSEFASAQVRQFTSGGYLSCVVAAAIVYVIAKPRKLHS
jgi:K+ transporter